MAEKEEEKIIESSASAPVVYSALIGTAIYSTLIKTGVEEALFEISVVYASNRTVLANSLKDRIERVARVDWNTVARQDSFGVSRNQRIQKSISHAYQRSQLDLKRLNREIRRIDRHIKAGNLGYLKKYGDLSDLSPSKARAKAVSKATKTQRKVTKKAMQYHENRLVRTEAKSIWYNSFIKKHPIEPVRWVCASNPCPFCSPYCNQIFKTAELSPMIPVHANCQCSLEVVKI